MNDETPDLYMLRLRALFSFMGSLRRHRLNATTSLAIVVLGYLLLQSIGVDPASWMARLAWWLSMVCGSLCLSIIAGTTLMLWRLEKERDRAFRGKRIE